MPGPRLSPDLQLCELDFKQGLGTNTQLHFSVSLLFTL